MGPKNPPEVNRRIFPTEAVVKALRKSIRSISRMLLQQVKLKGIVSLDPSVLGL